MKCFQRCLVLAVTVLGPLGSPASAVAADVYVAYDDQGGARFADRPLDGRYLLLIKDLRDSAAPGRSVHVASAPPQVRTELERAAGRYGLDYALLHAVVQTESGFDANAISPKGAIGLMQLMPDTARRYGVPGRGGTTLADSLSRMQLNIDAGSRHLRDLLLRYGGNTELALAAYNAGEGAVTRAGNQIPDYPETQDYVRKVMAIVDGMQTDAGSKPVVRSAQPAGRGKAAGRTTTVQTFRGEAAEVERFERGFAGAAGRFD